MFEKIYGDFEALAKDKNITSNLPKFRKVLKGRKLTSSKSNKSEKLVKNNDIVDATIVMILVS